MWPQLLPLLVPSGRVCDGGSHGAWAELQLPLWISTVLHPVWSQQAGQRGHSAKTMQSKLCKLFLKHSHTCIRTYFITTDTQIYVILRWYLWITLLYSQVNMHCWKLGCKITGYFLLIWSRIPIWNIWRWSQLELHVMFLRVQLNNFLEAFRGLPCAEREPCKETLL